MFRSSPEQHYIFLLLSSFKPHFLPPSVFQCLVFFSPRCPLCLALSPFPFLSAVNNRAIHVATLWNMAWEVGGGQRWHWWRGEERGEKGEAGEEGCAFKPFLLGALSRGQKHHFLNPSIAPPRPSSRVEKTRVSVPLTPILSPPVTFGTSCFPSSTPPPSSFPLVQLKNVVNFAQPVSLAIKVNDPGERDVNNEGILSRLSCICAPSSVLRVAYRTARTFPRFHSGNLSRVPTEARRTGAARWGEGGEPGVSECYICVNMRIWWEGGCWVCAQENTTQGTTKRTWWRYQDCWWKTSNGICD